MCALTLICICCVLVTAQAEEKTTVQSVRRDQAAVLRSSWSRSIVDREAFDSLCDIAARDRRDAIKVLIRDYLEAVVELSVAAADPDSGCPQGWWQMPLRERETSLWDDSVAVLGPTSTNSVGAVRDAWMRRAWLERPGDPTAAISPGIDLSSFLQLDWLTRRMLRTERDAIRAGAANVLPLHALDDQYRAEMAQTLRELRMRFDANMQASRAARTPADRTRLARERFVLPMLAYEVNRRYADRVTEVLSAEFGVGVGIGWRERFLRASQAMLFARLSPTERACLLQIDHVEPGSMAVNDSIRRLADVRWRTSEIVQRTLARSLLENGEWMYGITNREVIEQLYRSANDLDEATAAAARSIGAIDHYQQRIRWSDWLPQEHASSADASSE